MNEFNNAVCNSKYINWRIKGRLVNNELVRTLKEDVVMVFLRF